jgi:hypothetical protein
MKTRGPPDNGPRLTAAHTCTHSTEPVLASGVSTEPDRRKTERGFDATRVGVSAAPSCGPAVAGVVAGEGGMPGTWARPIRLGDCILCARKSNSHQQLGTLWIEFKFVVKGPVPFIRYRAPKTQH